MSDNPDRSLHSQREIPNHVPVDMEFSKLVTRSLDILGYNEDMIKHRIDNMNLNQSLDNACYMNSYFELNNAGSQAEGVVGLYGSDLDMMGVYNTVICANNPLQFMDQRNHTLFQTNNHDTEPGYTKLKLIKIGKSNSSISESLFQSENGDSYISSELFTNIYLAECRTVFKDHTLSKAGPAVPIRNKSTPNIINDMVYCFKCYCPDLLRSWLRRPRQHNWPSRNILYDISQMEAHVVPVGCKGSDTFDQEWRICFTKAEIHLFHSLNDIQIKLYVVLKMVAKFILKYICPEITSYIIKNIVLWMCELLPIEHFTEDQLVRRIFQALQYLRKCAVQNYLPSYMIPERNLFHGRIEQGQKRELIDSLSMLIDEGPSIIFHRLEKICDAMSLVYQNPRRVEFYMIKRNIVEKLFLLQTIRKKLIVPLSMTGTESAESDEYLRQDELYQTIGQALLNILLPEWLELSNATIDDIINTKLETMLS